MKKILILSCICLCMLAGLSCEKKQPQEAPETQPEQPESQTQQIPSAPQEQTKETSTSDTPVLQAGVSLRQLEAGLVEKDRDDCLGKGRGIRDLYRQVDLGELVFRLCRVS